MATAGYYTNDYYGTIAGLICAGPVDELVAIIVDSKVAWPTADAWAAGTYAANSVVLYNGRFYQTPSSTSATPPSAPWVEYTLKSSSATVDGYTSVAVDSLRASIRLYWGSTTQNADAALINTAITGGDVHPKYLGMCYAVFEQIYFGSERLSAPNVEFIVRKKPTQSQVTGTPSTLVDATVNPVAACAEFLTSQWTGVGIDAGSIDSTSFQSAATYLNTKADVSGISPLIDTQVDMRSIVANLAECSDMWLRMNHATGKIEAGVWQHGSAPGAYTTITQQHLTEPIKVTPSGWGSAKTGVVVSYADRERFFKASTETVNDLRSFQLVGEHRRDGIDRSWITRRLQARTVGAQWQANRNTPSLNIELTVRRAFGKTIRPGDWVYVDIDPSPNGTQVLQFARVMERTIPNRGPVRLRCEAEQGLKPLVYTPVHNVRSFPTPEAVADIADYRIVEAPVAIAGGVACVLPLAARPNAKIVGMDVYYGDGSTYQFLGTQRSFAVKCSLVADLSSTAASSADELTISGTPSASPLRLSVPVATDSATLLASTPPGAAGEAGDELLLVVAEISGGQVSEDASGRPKIEYFSVAAWNTYAANTLAIQALRARLGSEKQSFTAANASAWLVWRRSMQSFAHNDFSKVRDNRIDGLSPSTVKVRLVPFTKTAEKSEASCPDITFQFPKDSASKPSVAFVSPGVTSFPYTFASSSGGTIRLKGKWSDSDRNIISWSVSYRKVGDTGEIWIAGDSVARTALVVFDLNLALNTSGEYLVFFRAVDATGLRTETSVGVNVPQPGGKVATPTCSPTPAGYAEGYFPINVTLSCGTAGATISYQVINIGDAPGGSWTTYTAAVSVGANKALVAKATKSGLTDSDQMIAEFWARVRSGRFGSVTDS